MRRDPASWWSTDVADTVQVTILALDDEPAIRKLLETGLAGYGYSVIATSSGREALDIAAQRSPDLLLLDVNLGTHPDGIDVCRQFRAWSNTPIIMLTVRDDKQMKLAALDNGADDYVTKPFDMEELEARIRAVLRRSANRGAQPSSGVIHVQDLTIDLVSRRVRVKGNDVHLTPKEFELLKLLASNAGRVLTFRMLFEQVWGPTHSANPEQSVRVFVNTLRKKLGDDLAATRRPKFIFNEPGIGYRFADIETASATEMNG
jgi:two-component system KDP operon response regulator KdpE